MKHEYFYNVLLKITIYNKREITIINSFFLKFKKFNNLLVLISYLVKTNVLL